MNTGDIPTEMRPALARQVPTSRSAPPADAILEQTFRLKCGQCRKNAVLRSRFGNYYAIDQESLYRWVCFATV